MIGCEQAKEWMHPYVDGEIAAHQEITLEAHLMECPACAADHQRIRKVVDAVRGARPLYDPHRSLARKLRVLVGTEARRRGTLRVAFQAVAATAVLAALVIVLVRPHHSFTAYAAETHLRVSGGKLPLDIVSGEAAAVSAWLRHRLPFAFSIPNHPTEPGQVKFYSLKGARIMQYADSDVAYLAYAMNGRPVSLLVGTSARIVPDGSEVYRSGNLLFHFSNRDGLKTITWRDGDLVYALVSDLQVSHAQSCVVCHGTVAERSRFEGMSPER
jgi:anti-sigma factor RsiW